MADKENTEFGLEELTPPESVDYFIYRLETSRWRKAARNWMIAALIVFLALIATNAGWIWYESQFEDVQVSQEVTQSTDQGGNNQNTLYAGDYYGDSEGENNHQETSP